MVVPAVSSSSFLSTKYYPQWIATVAVLFTVLQMGAMCGWTSPYLARLTTPNDELWVTPASASWIAALLHVGRVAGTVLGLVCTNVWGSKRAMEHTLIVMLLGWCLVLFADSALILYFARALSGMGIGMIFCCFPLYVGEIAFAEIRGAIFTLTFCGAPLGILSASVAGFYLSLRHSAIVFIVPCVLNIALFLWLPDSPHRLVGKGDLAGAKRAISWYRNGRGVDEELANVQKFINSSSESGFLDFLRRLRVPYIRKAVFISMMLFMYMQISGLNSILFYMEIIFQKGQVTLLRPSLAVILVSIAGVLAAVASTNLMDKCGRRVLLIGSGSGVTLAMLMLGTHFALLNYLGLESAERFQALIIAGIFVFIVSFMLGLMPVPSAVLGELFAADTKCQAAFVSSLIGAIFAFGSSKLYQPMVDGIGEAWVFFIHALLIITVVPFVLLCLPETKGKSLQEIQDILNPGGVVKNNNDSSKATVDRF
ncbi:hypothetical protein TKK_0002824 [Trichogramma kaykai]|uniref:Major facilitator superfamily (MFS) profile domain-containing protein n=1 Tax=Trichogramma kaykai TaxID=54128 RepID=A0ABD2XTH2_9HYME